MIQVIINADDYGHDENRTRAIQEAFKIGAITATTAMANRPWFERAMKEAVDLGIIRDVGLHFNISEGEPLTDEMRDCSVFCDVNGCFAPNFHRSLKGRLHLPSSARRAIRSEADAQIRKYLDCGGVLMHLDSHHHVHTDFSVTPTLYAVAEKYGFRSARLSRNLCRTLPFAARCYKRLWNIYSRSVLPSRVDYFGGFDDFVMNWKRLPSAARAEVMVHPLYADESGALSMGGVLCDARIQITEEMIFWSSVIGRHVEIVRYSK